MAAPNDKKPQGKPGDKPPAGKAPDKAADKAKKPDKAAPASNPLPAKAAASRGGGHGRKLGQVLIDLGFIDDDQLWEILDEGKNTSNPVGQVALSRGLITEDQLQQALADQFGMRVVNAEELKPSAEALTLVPETMSS